MAERVESHTEDERPDPIDVSGASNVLLLAPSIGTAADAACLDLLARTPPASTHVLAVTFTKSPVEWVAAWNGHADGPPASGTVVSVGEGPASVDDPWTVRSVENPADLTSVGIQLSEAIAGLADADDGEAVAVCFDSVTSLLQYADLQRAFRFLHVVTGRVKTVGGVGHYHLDPAAHDEQERATLAGLFDAVAEVDEDGAVHVGR